MKAARISARLLLALVVIGSMTPPAANAAEEVNATGPAGQTLTVSQASGLPVAGTTIRVTGRGYDTRKGIYIALCKDNGAGKVPTPCGGGADTSGTAGASHWISSNPPPYGRGLAVPYGQGGTFDVRIRVGAALSNAVDCTEVRCAVVTRADHTRTGDRSQDVRVPVEFDDGGSVPVWAWGAGGIVLVAGAGAAVFVLRRRSRTAAS